MKKEWGGGGGGERRGDGKGGGGGWRGGMQKKINRQSMREEAAKANDFESNKKVMTSFLTTVNMPARQGNATAGPFASSAFPSTASKTTKSAPLH